MGGLYGHINHLHEDRSLTIAEIKDILTKASEADLDNVAEKSDGFNIYLSFREGETVCARSKGDIKKGGVTFSNLVKKDFANDRVKRAFLEAFKTFENAIYDLDEFDIKKIFGEYGNIYYNCEIITPDIHNVINYDQHVICIHDRGHAIFDQGTGDPVEKANIDENTQYLEKVVDKLNSNLEDNDDLKFKIVAGQEVHLEPMDDKHLDYALRRIKALKDRYNLTDHDTVKTFLRHRLNRFLEQDDVLAKVDDKFTKFAVDSLMGKASMRSLPSDMPGFVKDHIKRYGRSRKVAQKLLKEAIRPLADVIHDFTVARLQDVHSAFLESPETEIERIKNKVKEVIELMKDYKGTDAEKVKDILYNKLDQIDNISKINFGIEGIVFSYNDKVYKFTGNFAPVNQLLNIYKYGRGNIPPLKNISKSEESLKEGINYMPINTHHRQDQTVQSEEYIKGVFPGGFKPPHIGHYKIVEKMLGLKNTDGDFVVQEVRVLISPKERVAEGDRDIIVDAEMSKEIWDIFLNGRIRAKAVITDVKSPIHATYNFLADEMPEGSTMVVARGAKDMNDRRFKDLRSFSEKHDLRVSIEPITVSTEPDHASSSQLRKAIADYDEYTFTQLMPDHLTADQRKECWEIVNRQDKEKLSHLMEDLDLLSIKSG